MNASAKFGNISIYKKSKNHGLKHNIPFQCVLVKVRLQVQYDQFFQSFSYFVNLLHEPLVEWNNSKIEEKISHILGGKLAITTLSLTYSMSTVR